MDKCTFFEKETKTIQSREIRADRQPNAKEIQFSWCCHKHSPVPRKAALSVGGGNSLTCNGLPTQCTVPEDKVNDIDL